MTREPPAAQLLAQIARESADAPSLWQLWVSRGLDIVGAAEWDALLEPDDAPLLSWGYLQGLEEAGCVGGETSWQPAHLLIRQVQVQQADASAAQVASPPVAGSRKKVRRAASPAAASELLFGEGQLVAAAPAYIKYDSDGEWVFDFDWASFAASQGLRYYPKLVLAVPFNPVGGSRLLTLPALPESERATLCELLLNAAKNISDLANLSSAHILFPRPHQPTLDAIAQAGFLPRQQEQYHFHNEGYRTFEDFLGRLRGNRRNAIRRERRALREAGITVRTYAGLEGPERPPSSPSRGFTLAELDAMFDLYVSTSLRYTGAQPYLNRRFFHLCAERLGARLELVLAHDRDGVLVGGAWNLRGDRRLFGRYWGQLEPAPIEGPDLTADPAAADIDPETGLPLGLPSPPPIPFLHFEVCYYHSVERCIAEGLEVFEPGHGGEHKLSRGFTPVLTHSAHYLRDMRLRRPISLFLRYEAPQVLASAEAALKRCPLSPREAPKNRGSENSESPESSESPETEDGD